MRIVTIGGGPAALYFSLLMKRANPAHHVTVLSGTAPDDAVGMQTEDFARACRTFVKEERRVFEGN